MSSHKVTDLEAAQEICSYSLPSLSFIEHKYNLLFARIHNNLHM